MSKKNDNDKNTDKSKTRFWSKAGKIVKTVGSVAVAVIPVVIAIIGKTSKDK
ncbi:hypothetical protein MASR1M45_29210 [Candidatus Kapaibacterium sp.]